MREKGAGTGTGVGLFNDASCDDCQRRSLCQTTFKFISFIQSCDAGTLVLESTGQHRVVLALSSGLQETDLAGFLPCRLVGVMVRIF